MAKCPNCSEVLINQNQCECGWRKSNSGKYEVDHQCPYRDFEHGGDRCDRYGHLSEATNGSGPWYCRDHFPFFMRQESVTPKSKETGHKHVSEILDGLKK